MQGLVVNFEMVIEAQQLIGELISGFQSKT